MASSPSAEEGMPIPSSLISTRLIDGLGVQSVIQSGLVDTEHHSVGFTATLSAEGTDLSEFTLWIVGEAVQVGMPVSDMFPDANSDAMFNFNVVPENVFFFPNSSSTQWASGTDAVRRGEITITGGEQQEREDYKNLPWVFRFSLVTTGNIRAAKFVLQSIPVSMSVMDSLTDPLSPDLCVINFTIMSAPWALPPDPSFKCWGCVPVFRDRRGAEAKANGVFPKSILIKKFMSRALLSCSKNPSLTQEEVNVLLGDNKAHPPSRAAEVAEWPPIPPELTPSNISGAKAGMTPAQASQQTRGVPVMARDQSALSSAAQKNLASQAGRPIADPGDEKDPVPLSTEAKNRRDILMNMFENELPENLPSFELLAGMTLTDCLAVINNKLEKARESAGVGSDVEAFQRATSPVIYSTVQIDNRLDQLHSTTFLRAPLSEPEVWSHLMPKKLAQITTFLPDGSVGFDCGVSDGAIKKMSDRTVPLELKHILKVNAYVEKSAPISKRRAVEGVGLGDTCEVTYVTDYDFKDAEFPWEILECMLTASAINQQLWPIDNCFHNIIRVLGRFHLFFDPEINTKFQVKLCREFIDTAFLSNSRKAKNQLPCLTLKQCEDIAVDTLRRNKRSGVVSPFKELAASNGHLKPGQNSAQFNLFALSNFGKAQKAQAQRQLTGGYGGYGRGGSGQQVLAAAAGGSWMPPGPPPPLPTSGSGSRSRSTASGSGNKSALQICPAFAKGIPCVRGGEKASCSAANGIVLHHICGICASANHGTNGHT